MYRRSPLHPRGLPSSVLALGSELEWPAESGDAAEKQKGNLEECSMLMVLKVMKRLEIGVQEHPACAPNSPCANQLSPWGGGWCLKWLGMALAHGVRDRVRPGDRWYL